MMRGSRDKVDPDLGHAQKSSRRAFESNVLRRRLRDAWANG
jgi:hypothetical protein